MDKSIGIQVLVRFVDHTFIYCKCKQGLGKVSEREE
jgi:hypothetical protein